MTDRCDELGRRDTVAGLRRWSSLGLAVALAAALLVAGTPVGPVHAAEEQPPTACPEGVPRAGFPDTAGTAHEANIDCVGWYEIVRGTLPGAYLPARPVRRDQLASFVVRLLEAAGVALPEASDQGFRDIEGNAHAEPINQLVELGVVRGTSESTYTPGQAVRRDQMATFLVNAYEEIHGAPLEAESSGFTDVEDNPHEETIDKAATAGFVRGTTSTTYSPGQPVRRGQMASFLARALDRGVDDGHIGARQPPPPALTASSRLHVRTVGVVEAGMTLAEVEERTGTELEVHEFETFDRYCYYAEPAEFSAYTFLVVADEDPPSDDPMDGIVARVTTSVFDDAPTATVAGVRPGDPRAAVVDAYGADQLEEHPHTYHDGSYLDVVAADGVHGLRFEISPDGVVEIIHAGDAQANRSPEGCA